MTEGQLQTASFATPTEFRDWLRHHAAGSEGIWLKIAKKGAPAMTITYDQALDEALCIGWIDGQKRPLDESYWLQKFTPRRKRSPWSKRNRERSEALLAAGRMSRAALEEVRVAKADGRWQKAYASQRTALVADDLAQALAAEPKAEAFFASLTRAQRYSFIYRIERVKRAETRVAKISHYVALLREGKTLQ